MNEMVLTMKQVEKRYRNVPVLQNITMNIPKGAIYGLVGNNGAGKSTLMRLVSGQSCMDRGEIRLFGKIPEGKEQRVRHRIGTLIEEPGFYGELSAAQNLEYYRLQYGIPEKDSIDRLLDIVGLGHTGKKKYRNFSMGMKQRLGLALALLPSPEFLILDEPINGLDPEGILEIRNTLLQLNRENGITLLISSHILAELENVATEYGFLSRGKLLEQITAKDLKDKCGTCILLEVGDPAQMSVILEKELGITEYKLYPDGHFSVSAPPEKKEAISRAAVQHGISLHSISAQTMELEDYYMNLMGGEVNA